MKKGIIMIIFLIFIIALTGCSSSINNNTYHEEVVGVTRRGTPIIEKPVANINWKSTPSSTCFSKIGYDENNENLYVIFRDSGEEYRYTNFSYDDWNSFNDANSLGSYFNNYIKGFYYCEKIEK